MPRKEIDYSKIVIYKIACNDLNVKDIYVGSTTDFVKRKSAHKLDSNKHKKLKVYNMINSYGGWDNWCMIKIEDYPCKSSIDARARERYQYELLNATLNMVRPIMTKEERLLGKMISYHKNIDTYQAYHEANKEKINKRHLSTYHENKEEINKIKREQYDLNKAEHAEYQTNYRKENNDKVCERERKWYHKNKEHIRARVRLSKKAWYEANTDAINEKRREKNKLKKDLEKTHLKESQKIQQ